METTYTANLVDAGLFHILGKTPNSGFSALRAAVDEAGTVLRLPPTMYEEVGGDPTADRYPSGSPYVDAGISEDWIGVTDPVPGVEEDSYPDAETPAAESRHVARAYIAEKSKHSTANEWNDTVLVGAAVRLFERNERMRVIVHTNDRKLARAALRVPPEYGYYDIRVELYDPSEVADTFPVAGRFLW
jgi:hypothetical protein